MGRHIKLRGEVCHDPRSFNYGQVCVKVLEQSHFGLEFGLDYIHHSWRYGSRGFVHGNVRIYSDVHDAKPAGAFIPIESDGNVGVWINLLNNTADHLTNGFVVSTADWKLLKEAVKAYNEYFKD